jgi:hypothetical protein
MKLIRGALPPISRKIISSFQFLIEEDTLLMGFADDQKKTYER